VIKPKPLRPAVEGGFTAGDFTVDEEQGTVTCPAGNTVALSRTRVATFGALCRDCPLREQCTTCKTGRKLVLHERDDLLRAARRDWAATGLRKDPADRSNPKTASGVSRLAGQAGTQATDPTPAPGQTRGSRAGSTYPHPPCSIMPPGRRWPDEPT
jgi:Transposase DDE domain